MSVFLFHAKTSAPKVLKFYSQCLTKLLLSTIVVLALISSAHATGPLRIDPSNPRYFFDGNGKAVYLAGSYQNPYNLLSNGTQDFLAYFDFLAQQNHNFTRVWAWEQAPWTYDQNGEMVFTQQPYQRMGPGTALDGGLKFDITRFNQAYFDQLRDRIIAAGQRGIYVSLILFEGFSTQRQVRQVNPWLGDPFQSENNINGVDADSNRDGRGAEFFSLSSPSVTALQEAFVRKVVDTLNDLDNVLYEISGDTLPGSLAWQNHMVEYLKAHEASKPNQHPVGISQFYPKGIADVFNSSADWIVMQGTSLNPALAGASKVLFLEASPTLLRKNPDQWVWKTFTRGYNPIYPEDSSVSSSVHAAIAQTRAYSQFVNMSSMSPSDTACSNKFCLVSPGANYLVYLPSRGAVTVDLSATNQSLAAAWFDPATGQTISGNSTSGGTQVRFTSPVGGQSVLQLLAEASMLARPTGTTNIESSSRSLTAANSATTQSLTSSQSALQSDTVAAPTITPNGGIYSGSVTVTLKTATSGATIYYTTDGQTPTEGSQKYKRAFTLTSSTLVKAIAVKTNMNPSAQASAWFSNSGGSVSTVTTPTITPNGGSFASSVSVTMASATSGASIHYTTDGSSPTQSSTPYTGAISLTNSTTLKAKAFKIGYDASTEASASFNKSSTSTVSSGLVAYWNFDEGNGTTAADSSGNGNHGKLVNGPQWGAGVAGNALYFDGIDDNVTVSNSNSLNFSNSFTLSAWVFPTTPQNKFTAVMSKNSASDHTYFLYATSWDGYCGNTGAPLAGANITGAQQVICSPSALPLNTWTHLTSTYDGSNLSLYINGILAQRAPAAGTIDPSTGPLQIGASYFGEYFKGLIDEVQIYNTALTNTEIQTVYRQNAVNLPFDYAISNSGNRSVTAGSSVTDTINGTLQSGTPQAVSFSVSGLPSGATGSFSSVSCLPTCSSTLTVATSGSTPSGSFPITITATGGGITRTTGFTLSVAGAAIASTVATPTITPNGGSFASSVSVTMASATSGASIHYTTDGSSPTQSSTPYIGAISLTNSTTLKARAFKTGSTASAEASASFTKSSTSTVSSGLVAYWNFDEGTGTTAADSSGNGNHGTLVNGPQWAAGIAGKALYFDGGDDNVTVSNSNSLNLSNSFTLSAWVHPTAAQNKFTAVMAKNSASDHTYFLYASSWDGYCGNTGAPLGGANIATVQQVTCSSSALSPNAWSHLTSTYDGSNLSLYVNGILAQRIPAAGTIDPSIGPLQIGASYFGEYFQGLIDEVQIYNTALTDTEIQTVYRQNAANLPFDYSISSGGNQSVVAGSSANNTIAVALVSGISQAVSFSIAGLPNGATASFSPASCIATCSSGLTINTTGSTTIGSFPIIVTATGGGVTRTTAFALSVVTTLTLAAPTITPNGGTFSNSVSVTMQSATSGSTIHYTTDGSIPTQSSTLYNGALTLTSNASVKAVAFKTGYSPSAVAAATFTNSLSGTSGTSTPKGTGNIYYVATNGSDSNPGTLTNPFRTLAKGTSVLRPGDTLYIRSGTYREQITWPVAGSEDSAITISNYQAEAVTIRPADSTMKGRASAYIIFNGLILDGIDAQTAWPNGFSVCCPTSTPAPHHITFKNGEIKNFSANGVELFADSNKILNNKIHNNATNTTDGPPHGLYISGANNIFDGNEVYDNGFYGFHVYLSGGNSVSNNVIRNNLVHHNGLQGYSATNSLYNAGILISSGSSNRVYNNIVYSNGTGPNSVHGGGIQVFYRCNNCGVWNNTIYGNNGFGVEVYSSSDVDIRNNIVLNNKNGPINDSGTATMFSNNLTINANFVNESASDFRLQSGSAAIDTGTDLTTMGISTDYSGASRPTGFGFDIGAYEYKP